MFYCHYYRNFISIRRLFRFVRNDDKPGIIIGIIVDIGGKNLQPQDGKYDERAVKPNIQTPVYSGEKPAVTPTPVKQAKLERSGDYLIDEDG